MITEQSDLLNAKRVHPNIVYNILETDSSRTLLLCDGLDEMCSNNDVSGTCMCEILHFCGFYSICPVFISHLFLRFRKC